MRTESPKTLAAYWEKFTPEDIDYLYRSVLAYRNNLLEVKMVDFHKGMLPFIPAQVVHDIIFKYDHNLNTESMLICQRLCEVLKAHRPSILTGPYDPQHLRALTLRARFASEKGLIVALDDGC